MLKLFKRKKKDNKGFTLVELVIVVAILAILVGILAPQYTKYVEKSRKSADTANMDEMVKAVQVYAADPDNDLAKGDYVITIKDTATNNVATTFSGGDNKIISETIADFAKTKLRSKKWLDDKKSPVHEVTATIHVDENGATTVEYTPASFADAMNKTAKTSSQGS